MIETTGHQGTATPAAKEQHAHTKLDGIGIWVSTVCAVHCLVMPVVLVTFPLFIWLRWTRRADLAIFVGAAGIGLLSCLLSLRHHRDWTPLSLVVVGIALNGVARWVGGQIGPLLAQTLLVSGPLFMAYGMWRDRRACRGGRLLTA